MQSKQKLLRGKMMDYERGLENLKQLGQGTDWYNDILPHETALLDRLNDELRAKLQIRASKGFFGLASTLCTRASATLARGETKRSDCKWNAPRPCPDDRGTSRIGFDGGSISGLYRLAENEGSRIPGTGNGSGRFNGGSLQTN